MASFVYNNAALLLANGGIDFDTDVLKIMLVQAAYVADNDNVFIEEGVDDANEHELTVTGYTPGFGGAGRKTATVTAEKDDGNNRAELDIADLTWTALGTGETIAGAILIKEITNDLASLLLAYFDVTNTPTNGGDVTLDFDAVEGAIRLST